MKIQLKPLKQLLIMIGILLMSCSKDSDDPEKKLELSPEVKPATEISTTSFVANWKKVEGAKYYLLEVSKDIEFTLPVADYFNTKVTGTSFTVSGLSASEKYFYRVKAGNGSGETDYSKVMAGRSINKDLLYNSLWKGDEEKSDVTFILQDLYFNSNGSYSGYAANTVVSSGTWQWEENGNTITVQSTAGSFEIKFLDIGDSRFVAYVSAVTDGLLYFIE